MKILVLNAGSSSLKWKLFEMDSNALIASGIIEGISEYYGSFKLMYLGEELKIEHAITDHNEAFSLLFEILSTQNILNIEDNLDAIGHRVVHGGETFTDIKGLGWKMPLVGFVMTVFMFSLTGLPPTAGFIGKFYLFAALIEGGT